MDDAWIVIPNWDKFQHYKDRDPTWIKVYTELNSSDEWMSCSCSARGLLVTCWLEYARSRGVTKRSHIGRIAGAGFKQSQLDSLNRAGFIEFSASAPAHLDTGKPLALARSREEEKEEKRQELSKESSVSSHEQAKKNNTGKDGLLQEARTLALAWNGGSSDQFDNKLDTLEAVYQTKLGYLERDKLWDIAFTKTVQDDELF